MGTIYKKELKQLFTGMIGPVFIAFILVFSGIYLTVLNLNNYYPNSEQSLANVSLIFLMAVPILSMRSMAEETRSKTDQMLFTAPISMGEIVLGKFFAMITVFGVAVGVMGLYPLVLSLYGTVDFGSAYAGLLAFFCLGSMLISIGLFISTLTESPIIAAVATLGVLLVVYFITGIVSLMSDSTIAALAITTVVVALIGALVRAMTGNTAVAVIAACCLEAAVIVVYAVNSAMLVSAVSTGLMAFAAFNRLDNFTYYSIFDLTALVYYISIAALFCFLASQSLEKRRWN